MEHFQAGRIPKCFGMVVNININSVHHFYFPCIILSPFCIQTIKLSYSRQTSTILCLAWLLLYWRIVDSVIHYKKGFADRWLLVGQAVKTSGKSLVIAAKLPNLRCNRLALPQDAVTITRFQTGFSGIVLCCCYFLKTDFTKIVPSRMHLGLKIQISFKSN